GDIPVLGPRAKVFEEMRQVARQAFLGKNQSVVFETLGDRGAYGKALFASMSVYDLRRSRSDGCAGSTLGTRRVEHEPHVGERRGVAPDGHHLHPVGELEVVVGESFRLRENMGDVDGSIQRGVLMMSEVFRDSRR